MRRSSAVLKCIDEEDSLIYGVLEADLLSTDRILQRWAASIGDGIGSEMWEDRPIARAPQLDWDIAIIVDQIICRSPPTTKRIIKAWYKTPLPVTKIAKTLAPKLSMTTKGVYVSWRLALLFLKHRFEGARNQSLLNLLKARG